VVASRAELRRVQVLVVAGNLDLDLSAAELVPDVVYVDVTVYFGYVQLVVPPNLDIVHHRAFVLRRGERPEGRTLHPKLLETADLVVTTLAFVGEVVVRDVTGRAPPPVSSWNPGGACEAAGQPPPASG
jgi:hypothetical protein